MTAGARLSCPGIALFVLGSLGLGFGARAQTTDPLEAAAPTPPTGPYLTHTPLDSLTATRERPLFLPSRQAPGPVRAPVTAPLARAPPPRAVEEEAPRLTLLGIIRASDGGGSAVILDESNHQSVDLKVGDNRRGWVVQAIDAQSVTIRKDQQASRLTFPPVQTRGPHPIPNPDAD